MRHIKELSFETISLLNRIHKSSKKHEPRERAKCIVLSFKGYRIDKLVTIFGVHLNTIYNWLNNWEKLGLLSIYNSKGQGRKLKIGSDNEDFVRKLMQENPKQINKVVAELKEKKGVEISKRTLIRFVKKTLI